MINLTKKQVSDLIVSVDGPVVVVRQSVVRALGGDFGAAAFLSQVAFLSAKASEDNEHGWFHLPQSADDGGDRIADVDMFKLSPSIAPLLRVWGSWEEMLGVKRRTLVKARDVLFAMGLIEHKLIGNPARLHYRIVADRYLSLLTTGKAGAQGESGAENVSNKIGKKCQSRSTKSGDQDRHGETIKIGEEGRSLLEREEDDERGQQDTHRDTAPVGAGLGLGACDSEQMRHIRPARGGSRPAAVAAVGRQSEAFRKFFSSYPRPSAQARESHAVWSELALDAEVENVLAGVDRWSRSEQWTREGGKYVPGPVKFLESRLWEIAPPASWMKSRLAAPQDGYGVSRHHIEIVQLNESQKKDLRAIKFDGGLYLFGDDYVIFDHEIEQSMDYIKPYLGQILKIEAGSLPRRVAQMFKNRQRGFNVGCDIPLETHELPDFTLAAAQWTPDDIEAR